MTPMLLRGPADVLAIVPYLIGFHPERSVVVVALDGRRVVFGARCDLPGEPPDGMSVAGLADRFASVVTRQRVCTAILVGYGPPADTDPALEATARALTARGLVIHEIIRADAGRYWCHGCTDPDCCPAEGTPYDVSTSIVAASATVAGMVALPDRAALEGQVVTPDVATVRAMVPAVRRALGRLTGLAARSADPAAAVLAAGRDALDAAIDRQVRGKPESDDDIAWLALLAGLAPVAEMARNRVSTASAPDHVELWRRVLARTAPERGAPIATLLAHAAWRTGSGTLAGVAVDRALAMDPAYRPALRMDALLRAGAPPAGAVGVARADQTVIRSGWV